MNRVEEGAGAALNLLPEEHRMAFPSLNYGCSARADHGMHCQGTSILTYLAPIHTGFCAGVRGLFTGYLPTLLEDVPDMAFKFAAYESLRSLHRGFVHNRPATAQVVWEAWALGAS